MNRCASVFGPCRSQLRTAGFTVIEMVIGLAILTLVMGNMVMLQNATSDSYESGVFGSVLEDGAESTMDRIALAIMSTSVDRLDEVLTAPSFVSSVEYEVVTDIVAGVPVIGVPERIEFTSATGQILWTRDPGTPDEMQLTWTKHVPGLLEGEEANGIDDNGNGLDDEEGLAFNRNENQITVRLTLSRADSHGVVYTRTRSRRVTCRN
ncbi:MAG: hypothetical protein ACI9F9_000401 [Candidatus Paceibacteria bacterium]|jgi:hypothetical protein